MYHPTGVQSRPIAVQPRKKMMMTDQPSSDGHNQLGPSVGWSYSQISDFHAVPQESAGLTVLPGFAEKGYCVQEIGDGVHYVSNGGYDCIFVCTGSGVITVDAPATLGNALLPAIKEVTDEPVTHVVYSHHHADHIGAGSIFGPYVTIVAHDKTREMLERFPDPNRPVPTETFTTDGTLDMNGVKLELSYKGQNHCEGNIFVYAPRQKVLAAIDIFVPGWSPFRGCNASENIRGWVQAHDQILEYDFDAIVCGHANRWGTGDDAQTSQEYVNDMANLGIEALEQISDAELIRRAGFHHPWFVLDNWLNEMANYVTHKILTMQTSTGQRWTERLAGVDVVTKYHPYDIVELLRMEWGMQGSMDKRLNGEIPIPR